MPRKTEVEETEKNGKKYKKLSSKDYEQKILGFAKKGLTTEKIGEKLRQEGLH